MKVLVLEDECYVYDAFESLAFELEKRKKVEINFTFTRSISEFKTEFVKDQFCAVILDNQVLDGRALEGEENLAEWVRKQNPQIQIGLNSGDSEGFRELAQKVSASELGKEPMKLRSFLLRLKYNFKES